jgi:hypothetical protein
MEKLEAVGLEYQTSAKNVTSNCAALVAFACTKWQGFPQHNLQDI